MYTLEISPSFFAILNENYEYLKELFRVIHCARLTSIILFALRYIADFITHFHTPVKRFFLVFMLIIFPNFLFKSIKKKGK